MTTTKRPRRPRDFALPTIHQRDQDLRAIALQAKVDTLLGHEEGRGDDYICSIRKREIDLSYDVRDDFGIQWFAWRSALTLSYVTGLRATDILFGSQRRRHTEARRVCIWITRSITKQSSAAVASALRYNRTTVCNAWRIVRHGLASNEGPFVNLLQDMLTVETEHEL